MTLLDCLVPDVKRTNDATALPIFLSAMNSLVVQSLSNFGSRAAPAKRQRPLKSRSSDLLPQGSIYLLFRRLAKSCHNQAEVEGDIPTIRSRATTGKSVCGPEGAIGTMSAGVGQGHVDRKHRIPSIQALPGFCSIRLPSSCELVRQARIGRTKGTHLERDHVCNISVPETDARATVHMTL